VFRLFWLVVDKKNFHLGYTTYLRDDCFFPFIPSIHQTTSKKALI